MTRFFSLTFLYTNGKNSHPRRFSSSSQRKKKNLSSQFENLTSVNCKEQSRSEQNHIVAMSSSDSIKSVNMMESVALYESHIVEDTDYVLVEPQQNNGNNMEIDDDDDSYDYCDDVVSMLSVEQPSSLSVCSDLPSIDPTAFGIEPTKEMKSERRPRLISFGNDEDEARIRSERFQSSIETLDEEMGSQEHGFDSTGTSIVDSTEDSDETPERETLAESTEESDEQSETEALAESTAESDDRTETETAGPPPSGSTATSMAGATKESLKAHKETAAPPPIKSRLSNKKRRKKMKLLKKATAAAAAAAALSEMTALVPSPVPTGPTTPRRKTKASKKASNVAVACATETMEAFRQELGSKKKGSSKFVSPV